VQPLIGIQLSQGAENWRRLVPHQSNLRCNGLVGRANVGNHDRAARESAENTSRLQGSESHDGAAPTRTRLVDAERIRIRAGRNIDGDHRRAGFSDQVYRTLGKLRKWRTKASAEDGVD